MGKPQGQPVGLVGGRAIWLCPQCEATLISATGDTGVVPPDYRSRAMTVARDTTLPAAVAPPPSQPKGAVAPIRLAGPEKRPQRAQSASQPPTVREVLEKSQSKLGPQLDVATILMLERWCDEGWLSAG